MLNLLYSAWTFLPSWSGLEHSFQANVACFHSTFHTCCKHRRARLTIGQRHSHGHQRACPVGFKSRFNMVVWRGVRQVHALDMYDPVIRLQLQVFASDVKSTALAIRPFVSELAPSLRLVDADRHRPTFRAKQPFLD